MRLSKLGETNYTRKLLRPGLREEIVHQNRLKESYIQPSKIVNN